ncbi:MAG TPA: hypothetical protein VKU41_23975 [Polyangiaceae bacterium]|nr:hypothetical protein [Polyangiaceae bacterium]
MRRLRFVALLPFALACAHGESFDEGVFRKGDVRVEIGPVPADWRRVAVDGADLAFRDDAHDGSALFDVRCNVRDDDAPLSVLTDHLIMGTTEREVESQDVLPFDRREALHTRMHAKLDGVPMQYDIYVMKKDGCVYDLVYVADPSRFADGAARFERFALGLRASEGTGGARAVSRDP